jgi:hypothetical protein
MIQSNFDDIGKSAAILSAVELDIRSVYHGFRVPFQEKLHFCVVHLKQQISNSLGPITPGRGGFSLLSFYSSFAFREDKIGISSKSFKVIERI